VWILGFRQLMFQEASLRHPAREHCRPAGPD